jgi:hypothetical protein
MALLSSITLPNGRNYSFQYVMTHTEATACGNSPCPYPTTTAELSQISLPTGGYIKYAYECGSGPCQYPTIPWGREVATRTISSDGTPATEQTWSYAYYVSQDPTTLQWESTITDPLGNVQASWGPGIVPYRIDYRNSSGATLKQVFNTIGWDNSTYTDPYSPSSGNNPRVTSQTTVLSDTGQQSQVT